MNTGATLILACRNLQAGNALKEEFGGKNVYVIELDLAKLSSVRKFAEDYTRQFDQLDILINNAGVASTGPFKKTEDGLEIHMQVNALAPFLLTQLLLPALR